MPLSPLENIVHCRYYLKMQIKRRYIFGIILLMVLYGRGVSQNQRNGNMQVLHNPPQVDFSWVSVCFGDTTKFINGSIRGMTYTWTVYDKSMSVLYTSNDTNISYFFSAADTFYVKLSADNGHLVTKTETVVIGAITKADFEFMHCSNQFMNHSTCASTFIWSFGDGAVSTDTFPTHQYADTGLYTVKLVVSKGAFKDSVTKQIIVDVDVFPTGIITWHVSQDTLFVHAVDSMAGIFYNWNFGGGVHLYNRDTFYVYPAPGTYYLNFSDWNICSAAYALDTIYITTAGIKAIEKNNSSAATVYPNPLKSGEEIAVLFNSGENGISNFCVYNTLGEKVSEKVFEISKGTNKFNFNLSDLKNGLYFISIEQAAFSSRIKFIISAE
jgi:hypothetical protein